MKLRTQFIITMLLFGVILVILALSAVITNQQSEKTSQQENLAANIARGANEISYLANDYLIYRENQQLSRWQARFASFSNQVANLDVEKPEQQVLVRNIQANQKRLKEVFDSVVSAPGSPPRDQGVAFDSLLFQVSWSRMAVQSQALISDASRLSRLLDQQKAELTNKRTRLIYFMVGLFGLFLLSSYLLTYQRILKSITTLQAGTVVIGSGNLDFKIEEKKNDEIGELSHAINRMTIDLKAITASKADLEREVYEHQQTEESLRQRTLELQQLTETLEQRVRDRTAELAKVNESLRQLSTRLLSAHEEERKRIAGEIHDSLGSCLSAIKFKVENYLHDVRKAPEVGVEPLSAIIPMIHEGVEECRRIQMDLRPAMLDDLGLLTTFSWFCRRFQTIYSGMRVEQEFNMQEGEVPGPLKIIIYRVMQEAMNNIAKHSQADHVRLSLRKIDDRIEFILQDNGRGFDVGKTRNKESTKKGLGLTSMRERVELSGGSFEIKSAEGHGTTVCASWPIR